MVQHLKSMVKVMPKERAKKNKCAIADLEAALGLDSLEDEAAPSSSDGERIHGAMSELHMEPLQDLSNWFGENGDPQEDDDGDEEEPEEEDEKVEESSASRPVAAACRKRPLPQACRVCLMLRLFPTDYCV